MHNLAQLLTDSDRTYMDRTRPKGLDYIVIDNLAEIFNNLQNDVLMDARNYAEETTN